MSFAVPLAWALLAIAIPIIALYVLKVRLRRVKVSTNLFWKQVYEEKPPRAWWQNLRHLLSLLAQLLILLMLVSAVADPFFHWQSKQARRIVVVLDTSSSMKATDEYPTRFESARAAVHQLFDGLRFRDEVAIVAAGSRPEVVLGMASHTPTLRRALDSVQASDNNGCLSDAILLGQRLIGQHPAGEILVFSDGCQTDIESSSQLSEASKTETTPTDETQSVRIQFFNFATAAGNVGITQFQTRRSLVDPIGYQILLSVQNHSNIAVQGRVELTLSGSPIDVLPLKLQPDELWIRTLEKTSLAGGPLEAKLVELTRLQPETTSGSSATTQPAAGNASGINALTTDDQAWAMVPPRQVQNVLTVTRGNLFLQKVFEANPLVNLTVTDVLPTAWPTDAIIVLHRQMPANVPAGRVLVIDPETDTNLWTIGDLIQNPIITEQDTQSPLMTHIRMDNVLIPDARRLTFPNSVQSLASTLDGDSILTIVPRTEGNCLVLGVNLERSDLAFRTAFPILVTNALAWFAGQSGEVERSWNAGQIASLSPDNFPTEATAFTLLSPNNRLSAVVGSQVGPLDEVGMWRIVTVDAEAQNKNTNQVDQSRPVIQWLPVNLSDSAESDLRPRRLDGDSAGGDSATKDMSASGRSSSWFSGWLSRPLWFYLAMMATFFVAAEWVLYQRRWIS
ncbi:MAG: BatA and WFA domain-containing protein [Pirellulaceae bacterium]|nr:BatA and WFA domain-containing protein [Pirellulaceae bacterium]